MERQSWNFPGLKFNRRRLRDLVDEARQRGRSVTEIAAASGISTSTLYEYMKETGRGGKPAPEPTITVAFALSAALRCKPDDLIQ